MINSATLQNINKYRVSPDQRKIRMDKALEHLRNSCSFYRKQLKAGRLFLHEAPWNATSWKDPEVKELTDRSDTYLVRGPMCRWEMMATDRRGLQGTSYVRKETGWLTNSRELAELLEGTPHWWNCQTGRQVPTCAGQSCPSDSQSLSCTEG